MIQVKKKQTAQQCISDHTRFGWLLEFWRPPDFGEKYVADGRGIGCNWVAFGLSFLSGLVVFELDGGGLSFCVDVDTRDFSELGKVFG